MANISCDPQSLDNASRCFSCIPFAFKPLVNISLLNSLSGVNASPQKLLDLSRPFDKFEAVSALGAEVYLLGLIALKGALTPSQLADGAKCFGCGRDGDLDEITTYLYAVDAGGSIVPGDLMRAAQGYTVLFGIEWRVSVYLTCQWALKAGAVTSCDPSALLTASRCYTNCLSWYTLRAVRVYLLCFIQANGMGSGNLIPAGSTYTGAPPTFTVTVQKLSTYQITWGSNDLSMTIGGQTFNSTGAGTTLQIYTGTNTQMVFTGTFAGTLVTLVLIRLAPAVPAAPASFTWVMDGTQTNIVGTWTAPGAGMTKTELWTSTDNNVFVLSASVAAPGTTASIANPGSGLVYAQVRYCTANTSGQFFSPVQVVNAGLYTSLKSYWKLDDAAGQNAADAFGANTLNNVPGNQQWNVAGLIGGCADFNVAFQASRNLAHADNADFRVAAGQSITFSFWIKFASLNVNEGICTKFNAAAEYLCWMDLTPKLAWRVRDGGGTDQNLTVNAGPTLGVWHHVVVGFDNANNQAFAYYDNGARINLACVGVTTDPTNPFQLGCYNSAHAVHALIDETGMWKRVLTAAEVSYLFNAGAGKPFPF